MGSSSSKTTSPPDWSLLPADILVYILRRFKTLRDFFTFRAVCHSWRTAASPPSPYTLSSQSPLLLLQSDSSHYFSQAVFDVATRRRYSFRFLWNDATRITYSYSHGHLIKGLFCPNIVLSDLFTGALVRLPNHNAAAKGVLSARPDSAGRCRVVLFRHRLDYKTVQYLNVGDDRWTVASSPHELLDMMFSRGELFALNKDLDLLRVELAGDSLTVQKLGDGGIARTGKMDIAFWLSEFDGVMFLVIRMFVEGNGFGWGSGSFMSEGYDVFRWNLEEKKWEEIRDLGGDKSLFVSTYGNAVLFPVTGLGIRKNCVYSVSQHMGEWERFSLTDRSWEKVIIDDTSTSYLAVWVFPNHC